MLPRCLGHVVRPMLSIGLRISLALLTWEAPAPSGTAGRDWEWIWVPCTCWGVVCAPQLGSGALECQQWALVELMLLCGSVAHRACGSSRALQALMNVTTNVIYSAIHYWYWRDCILILSFAVKINTLHAGHKSVFAFNCKSE